MRTIVDDQGRVEIPRALRDRLHLTPGALVDVEPLANGVQVMPLVAEADANGASAEIVHEGTLLVVHGIQSITSDDVNRTIEAGREERSSRIAAERPGQQ